MDDNDDLGADRQQRASEKLPAAEAADRAGVSLSTLRRWVNSKCS